MRGEKTPKLVLPCSTKKTIQVLKFTTEILRYEVGASFLMFLLDYLLLLHFINMSSAFE